MTITMIIISIIITTLVVAAIFIFFRLGMLNGYKKGIEQTKHEYDVGIVPQKQADAVKGVYKRIHDPLWDLRHGIHMLPFEWGMDEIETRFICDVYCRIPSGMRSIMLREKCSERLMAPETECVLLEKYIGKAPFTGNEPPLKKEDFQLAGNGDYSAALYIVKVILAERARNMTSFAENVINHKEITT